MNHCAWVFFTSEFRISISSFYREADARKAMTKDRQNMQHRYIELFYDGSGSGAAGGGGRGGGGGGGGYSSGKLYLILTLQLIF